MKANRQLAVDARAELVARAKQERAPLDPATHPLVQKALGLAVNLAYLADLRPFAAWVETALRHGNRAGAPVRPPAVRAV